MSIVVESSAGPAVGGSTVPLLVVDDEAPIRRALARMLVAEGHPCLVAGDVAEALDVMEREQVGLVLSDIDMPGGSGLELLDTIATRWPDTAIVMVTGLDDPAVARHALEIGAFGYVVKPFDRNEILINVANALHRRHLELENRAYRDHLEALVEARTAEVEAGQEEMVRRLAAAAEHRDPETASHLERMSRYSELLARLLGHDDKWCRLMRLAAPMHDIGKIGIPDDVLMKTGRFDDADRAVMARHPEIGRQILAGSRSPLLQLAATVAHTHHERFDGSGYPRGLSGTEIPEEGRIVAIADVFDALTTHRRYKQAFTFEQAEALLREERGRHFDGRLVDLFLSARDDIDAISARFREPPATP